MRLFCTILTSIILCCAAVAQADVSIEPYTFSEDFETVEENGWASYPFWQDTAFDPNFKVGELVPDDPNHSIVQLVQPYSHVDNYAGAQKLLDMYLTPGSSVSLRFYIKSHINAEFFTLRFAAGTCGKVDFTVHAPRMNQWTDLEVTFADIARENPAIADLDRLKVFAIAALVKIPDADPALPFQFGLDDVKVQGARMMPFRSIEPEMHRLSEWRHSFTDRHFKNGDMFRLSGDWSIPADNVNFTITSFTDTTKILSSHTLTNSGDTWSLEPFAISYPEGMYLGRLTAHDGGYIICESTFTFIVAPDTIGGVHPRLLFDEAGLKDIRAKLATEKYAHILRDIEARAKDLREKHPLESVIYDYDQFNDIDLLVDLGAWSDRFHPWGYGIEANALLYAFTGDMDAARYAIGLLVKQCQFPSFSHPWMTKRGRHAYWQCQQADNFAIGYDILYDLMDEEQRRIVQEGLIRNYLHGSFETFVKDNAVTNSTSNWIAHMAGSPLMTAIAMYGDHERLKDLEPYFTGLIYKTYDHICKGTLDEGAYGEGWGYYGFSMDVWCQTVPALERNFQIDLSEPLNGSYQEGVWASNIKKKFMFYFGDSSSRISPIPEYAWLLDKHEDPFLGWLYHYLKGGETLQDILYDTENVPKDDPFDENPVRLFRDIGTTVFKSGWEEDDFIFVMRTGSFFNHQHLDKGTFWLADYGTTFIEERHGSTYDNTPYYRSHYSKPIGHSTILINGNGQSQRTGDILNFAPGFDDHASVGHFLDGSFASFSSNDLDKLYWGEVGDLKRNALYIKPRTILMLDTVEPSGSDVEVNLLFHTTYLKDIEAGTDQSAITIDEKKLHIHHLYPENTDIRKVETPHYYYTLRNKRPLVREGMLTVNTRTMGEPLTIANLLTTTRGDGHDITLEPGDGFVSGISDGAAFIFPKSPGTVYDTGEFLTDALAVTWQGDTVFAAMCTELSRGGALLIEAECQITCELTAGQVKYYVSEPCGALIGVDRKPSSVTVNGKPVTIRYDDDRGVVMVVLQQGEGIVVIEE